MELRRKKQNLFFLNMFKKTTQIFIPVKLNILSEQSLNALTGRMGLSVATASMLEQHLVLQNHSIEEKTGWR